MELLAGLGRPPAVAGEGATSAIYARFLDGRDRQLLVAEVEGIIAGIVSLVFRDRLNLRTPEAWIPDLYVSDGFRRCGIAGALLAACTEEARLRGCHAIRLECGFDRTEAHELYGALGFERSGYDYKRVLA